MSCKVCGKPSGVYHFCKECNEKKEAGLIIKNQEGNWVLKETHENEKSVCILCGKPAKYDLCYACYQEKNKIKSELEVSVNNVDDAKDYYNNLKYNIFKLKDMEYAITACVKLIALGEILENKYNCKEFTVKAKKEAVDLLEKKRTYLENLNTKKDKTEESIGQVDNQGNETVVEDDGVDSNIEWQDYRRVYPMNIRCKDGHYVRSKAEKLIDDYLFDNQIIHIYEKRVVNENNDETYYPDFYLPYLGRQVGECKGIYIEFFGLEDNKKYLATEKKKINYYKSKGFDVIEVRDCNIDSIEDFLEDQIRKIKKKYK